MISRNPREIGGWSTCLEVLGWTIDTDGLTISLPPHKRYRLRHVLAGWPSTRRSAACKQIFEFSRVLAARIGSGAPKEGLCIEGATTPLSPAANLSSSGKRSWGVVSLGPKYQGRLDFWRWVVEAGIYVPEGRLSAVANVPPDRSPVMPPVRELRRSPWQ